MDFPLGIPGVSHSKVFNFSFGLFLLIGSFVSLGLLRSKVLHNKYYREINSRDEKSVMMSFFTYLN